MKIITTVFASLLFITGAFVITDQSLAQDDCGGESSSYKLMVHVSNNKPTRVTHKGQDADDFYVCNGDEVEWQLVGSAKQYWVDFIDGAPFGGASRRDSDNNGKIQVIIDGDAGPEGYKYDIGLADGGLLDPRIIIGE